MEKIHNIINIVPCGEETPSHYVGSFIILSPSRSPRGEGYSPFQVGESIQHKQSGRKASAIHYSLFID